MIKRILLGFLFGTISMVFIGCGGDVLPKPTGYFRIDLPESLITEVEKCTTSQQIKQVGIEWAIDQSKELLAAGVPVLHYYSMGKSDNIREIAKELF